MDKLKPGYYEIKPDKNGNPTYYSINPINHKKKKSETIKNIILIMIFMIIPLSFDFLNKTLYNNKNMLLFAIQLITISMITTGIFVTKTKTKNIDNNIEFLLKNQHLITDNINNKNPITFGIQCEEDWKNKWNPSQPKNKITLWKIIKITIKQTIKYMFVYIILLLIENFIINQIV